MQSYQQNQNTAGSSAIVTRSAERQSQGNSRGGQPLLSNPPSLLGMNLSNPPPPPPQQPAAAAAAAPKPGNKPGNISNQVPYMNCKVPPPFYQIGNAGQSGQYGNGQFTQPSQPNMMNGYGFQRN